MPKLDGSLLINQRTLTNVTGHFKRRRLGQQDDKLLNVDDLVDLLYLIDLYVACPKICIDGSLPAKDIDNLKTELDFLREFGIDSDCFAFSSPGSPANEAALCSLSAVQATKSLEEYSPDPRIDQSLPAEDADFLVSMLQKTMESMAGFRGASNEAERAIEISRSFSHQRFRGSKAVAGFASLGFYSLQRALSFVQGNARTDIACSALINRFRFFYLRQLAFQSGAIYSPADRWEALSNQQHLHFVNFIKRQMGSEIRVGPGEDVWFPPIALYAMLTMDESKNRPLLERVAELRNEFSGLRGYFAKNTKGALASLVPQSVLESTDPRIDESTIRAVNDYFADRFIDAEYARQYGEPPGGTASNVIKYTVPVVLSLTVSGIGLAVGSWVGAAAGATAGAAALAGAWPVATDFIKEITKDIAADKLDAMGSASLDQYRRLHFRLLRLPEVAGRLQRIVKREFGCEISFASTAG